MFCEEPVKYDRVHLSSYFSLTTAEELSLTVAEGFYEARRKGAGWRTRSTINRREKVIHSSAGRAVYYDKLITWRPVPIRRIPPIKKAPSGIAAFTVP